MGGWGLPPLEDPYWKPFIAQADTKPSQYPFQKFSVCELQLRNSLLTDWWQQSPTLALF